MMKTSTRDTIVEVATSLMLRHGFNYTGIAQILKEAHVPKGSFYHYFENKDALGYAVIEKAAQDHFSSLDAYFLHAQGSPLEKLRHFFESVIEHYEVDVFVYSCILGNLAQELAEQHEGFRQQLEEVFKKTEQYFAVLFEDAKAAGELTQNADCLKLAEFLFTCWEGSVLTAKVKKSKQPLKNFMDQMFDAVLKHS